MQSESEVRAAISGTFLSLVWTLTFLYDIFFETKNKS